MPRPKHTFYGDTSFGIFPRKALTSHDPPLSLRTERYLPVPAYRGHAGPSRDATTIAPQTKVLNVFLEEICNTLHVLIPSPANVDENDLVCR